TLLHGKHARHPFCNLRPGDDDQRQATCRNGYHQSKSAHRRLPWASPERAGFVAVSSLSNREITDSAHLRGTVRMYFVVFVRSLAEDRRNLATPGAAD